MKAYLGLYTARLETPARSLKEKRALIKPALERLKARFPVSAARLYGLDAWGYLTLGHLEPGSDQPHDRNANTVTMVFGATGSVGDGLLKAAIEDPEVEKIYVVSRRSSPRIEAGVASGKVEMVLQPDFTNYGNLAPILGEVNTVLWGLGTSSLQVDDATYTRIHVDFPVAFLTAWLAARL